MRALSLFSGIGGMDLASYWAGIHTAAFCEKEHFCQNVLRNHWPNVPIYDDVKKITKEQLMRDGVITNKEKIDIITGGFPCQPFSIAGKQKSKGDDRYLWPEMHRIIRELKPNWVVGENVVGIVKLALDDILTDLEKEGYTCRTFVFPVAAVGAPHQRQRVWIVAYSNSFRQQQRTQESEDLPAVQEDTSIIDQFNRSGETCVADTSRFRCNCGQSIWEERSIQINQKRSPQKDHKSRKGGICGTCKDGENLANSNCKRLERREETRNIEEEGKKFGKQSERFGKLYNWENGTTQPLLGRNFDGISDELDSCKWPALLGQEQFDWEPPRVANGVLDRKKRLKAIGNAVVPLQCYPILKAIMAIVRSMEGNLNN